jgi:outer membrane protein OmpA-like peptidoglycan-associated protein
MAKRRSRRGYQPNVGPERQTTPRQRRRRRRRSVGTQIVVFLAFLFLAAAVAAAVYVTIARPDGLAIGMFGNDPTDDDVVESTTTEVPDSTSSSAVTTTTFATTTSEFVTTSTGVPLEGILENGRVTLTGSVPDASVGDQFVAVIENFVGPGNVDQVFTVDNAAPVPNSFVLRVVDNILFAAGGETINAEFFPFLDQIVQFMEIDPNITLVIEGHTDSTGSEVENLALSQRRAEAVQAYVASQGINEFRLEATGRGASEPVADEGTPAGRDQNRRIEFELVGFQIQQS